MERDPMQLALSTEIVMDIVLSHLKTRDLASCRSVSKFWNRLSSSTLRRRWTMMSNISSETDLMKLAECMRQSWDFPFAGLKFDRSWLLDSDGSKEFFIEYGARFTRLSLTTSWMVSIRVLAPFIKHMPNLAILEIGFSLTAKRDLELFSTAVDEETDELKLPSIRTIRIPWTWLYLNEDVLGEVLIAATSPSLQIECLGVTPAVMRVLQRCGKLGAISSISLYETSGVRFHELSEICQQLSAEPPALTKLHFHFWKTLAHCVDDMANGLKTIFLSIQHTLKELSLDDMEGISISWDDLPPTFSKLTTLSVCNRSGSDLGALFSGLSGMNFPVLRDVNLSIDSSERITELRGNFWNVMSVPSVSTIDLRGYITEDGMEYLAQIFPNVNQVRLRYGDYSGDNNEFGKNPHEIWNVRAFKNLEKLRIGYYIIRLPSNNYVGMDSFLTGMSTDVCQNLCKKQRINMDSNGTEAIIRENPNVLQLKNLKELVVSVSPSLGVKRLPKAAPFMSMVSVWYALGMMPNLEAKFVYEHSFNDEKCEKAVLKAAFKQVEKYVKLKPASD